jgi:hypothetical protein
LQAPDSLVLTDVRCNADRLTPPCREVVLSI